MRKSPSEGGCWFCWQDDGALVLEREFDTFVHVDCVRKTLADDPDHPEADLMRYLLEETA